MTNENPHPHDCLLAYQCVNVDCGFYLTQKLEPGNYFCPKCKYSTKPLYDYYLMFGLGKEYELAQLREVYKKLSLVYHPDTDPQKMDDVFLIIRKGFDVLNSEENRTIYDQDLMFFERFISGETMEYAIPEKDIQKRPIDFWWSIIISLMMGGGIYYVSDNPLYGGFAFLVFLTIGFIWSAAFVRIFLTLCESATIILIGYLLYERKWGETILLISGLAIYLILKNKKNKIGAR